MRNRHGVLFTLIVRDSEPGSGRSRDHVCGSCCVYVNMEDGPGIPAVRDADDVDLGYSIVTSQIRHIVDCLVIKSRDTMRAVLPVRAIFNQTYRRQLSNILNITWYLFLCVGIASGRETRQGPSYKRPYCRSHGDCRVDLGEICYKLYEGCSLGRCMCTPGSETRDSSGRCRTVRRGGETCYYGDKCPDHMTCHYNKCTCFIGEMTLDGDTCLRATEKILGHSCNPSTDTCVQKSGSSYVSDEVFCSESGVCECKQGFKADGYSCRRRRIGEYGCVENHHCDGGSVCYNRRCVCPPGRVPMAANTKCGRTGALHGLPLGASCDEIGEQRYCDFGLVCHSCGENGRSICVRSRLPPYQSPLYARQVASTISLSHTCLLVAIVVYILLSGR